MNQQHKGIIYNNYRALVDSISPQVEDVINYLFEKQIISKHMKENLVEGNRINRKRATELLDLIVTRGPYAFDALYAAVLQETLYEAADILKREYAPHEPTIDITQASQIPGKDGYESPEESLPDIWPSDEANHAYANLRLVEEKHSKMIDLFTKTSTLRGQDLTYVMASKLRGRVLIINNEKFDTLDLREGTHHDQMAIETLFRALYFEPVVETDKTAKEMWEILETWSKTDYHQSADCFVLFILSHGDTGVVYGTDGTKINGKPTNVIEIKNIVDLLSGCRYLSGKPKLFFIQACQGSIGNRGELIGKVGSGTKPDSSDITTSPSQAQETQLIGDDQDVVNLGAASSVITINMDTQRVLKDVVNDVVDAVGQKRPSGADVFVAMATVPGFISWRNTQHGTWFIQAIIYVFAKYAYKYDLLKLMTMVNNLVGRAEAGGNKYKQVAEKKDSFLKDFYFFPGLLREKETIS